MQPRQTNRISDYVRDTFVPGSQFNWRLVERVLIVRGKFKTPRIDSTLAVLALVFACPRNSEDDGGSDRSCNIRSI